MIRDFIVVVKDGKARTNLVEIGNLNASIYDVNEFQNMLNFHQCSAVMCLYLPKAAKWKETKVFNWSVEIPKLKFAFMRKVFLSISNTKGLQLLQQGKSLFKGRG
jgi:hypothetical protein